MIYGAQWTCAAKTLKYIAEALRPITEFRKYKVSSSVANRFFLLLRLAILGARAVVI